MKKILFLFIAVLISLNVDATKYYIDPTGVDDAGRNGLTTGTAWATLSYACTRATTAGDTIFVNAGTYTETAQSVLAVGGSIMGAGVTSKIVFSYANSTWSNACIKLESATEGTVGNQSISYLYLDGEETAYHGILVGRRSNVKLHHLTMVDFKHNAIYLAGSYVNEAEPTTYAVLNEIHDCNITNCSVRAYDINYYDGQIKIRAQDNALIYNNVIDSRTVAAGFACNHIDAKYGYNKGLKIYNNKSYKSSTNGGDWNFHIESWDGKGGNQVYDNEFYGLGIGIDIAGHFNERGNYAYSWLVERNKFINDTLHALIDAHFEAAVAIEGNTSDVIIRYNYVNQSPCGFSMNASQYAGQNPYDIQRIYIYYNLIVNIGYTNQNSWVFYLHNGDADAVLKDVFIDNNTIINDLVNKTEAAFFITPVGPMDNLRFRNNIIPNMRIASIYLYEELGQVSNLYNQNNLLYNNGDNDLIKYHLTPPVINYVVAGTIMGSDPLFVGGSPYSYKLQATSPARDAGIEVGLTTDYGGYSVPVGPLPDIGAWEYGADVTPPNWHPTGLGWDDIYFKNNFRDTVNFTVPPTIAGAPLNLAALLPSGLTATVNDLNATTGATGNLQGQLNAKAALSAPSFTSSITVAGDTTVTAVVGKVVYQAADSSFYGCRSTVAPKKWYKLHD